jgi:ferredoxin-NADP reductase
MNDAEQELRLLRVAAVRQVALDVAAFDLVAADGRELAPFSPGSHVDVHLPNGLIRQYSLCSDADDVARYTVAVKKESAGRGGSLAMHDRIEEGSSIAIAGPRNLFPLAAGSHHSLFVAGGIGITPIFAMIRWLAARGQSWELHYCARSAEHAAFYQELCALGAAQVHPYFSEAPLLDTRALLAAPQAATDVYCCGPEGLMKAVKDASADWNPAQVHFEWFAAPEVAHAPNQPFEVELAKSGRVLCVPHDQSLLQVLHGEGIAVPSACEEGVCGTCETRVLAGEVDHRDLLLSAAERAANGSMMACVSRACSARIVLDL